MKDGQARASPMEGQLREVTKLREEAGVELAELHRERSKARLLAAAERKVTTAFIGAVAAFEKHFGRLWSHGAPESGLSADQKAWKRIWEACRTEALDKGNGQARALRNELAEYEVEYVGHRLDLPAAQ